MPQNVFAAQAGHRASHSRPRMSRALQDASSRSVLVSWQDVLAQLHGSKSRSSASFSHMWRLDPLLFPACCKQTRGLAGCLPGAAQGSCITRRVSLSILSQVLPLGRHFSSLHHGKPQSSEALSRPYLSAVCEAMRKMTADEIEADVRRLLICLSFAQQG